MSDDVEHEKLLGKINLNRSEVDAQMNLDRAEFENTGRFIGQTMKSMGEKLGTHGKRHDASEKDIVCLKKKVFRIFATFVALGMVLSALSFVIVKFKEIKEFVQFLGFGG